MLRVSPTLNWLALFKWSSVKMSVHERFLVHRDDGLRGWRAVAQYTVRSFGIVVFSPLFDDDLSIARGFSRIFLILDNGNVCKLGATT